MSLWNDYLTRKLIFESHPSLDEKRCLSCLQVRNPCTSCMEICPEGVFSMPFSGSVETDWDACSDCELCVSTCPSRAISPARIRAEKLFAQASRSCRDISITCRDGFHADLTVGYPGSVSWELLCFFALQGSVTLITEDCEQCDKATCRRAMHMNLEQAALFLGDKMFRSRVIVTKDPAAAPSRRYTRREAISLVMKRTGRTAALLLPVPQDSVPDGTLWRQLLVRRVRQLAEREADDSAGALHNEKPELPAQSETNEKTKGFNWVLPHFTDKCTACGLCTRMCPAGALLRAPGPEGSGRFYMALLPHKCTGCGLCGVICPEGGILAPSPFPLDDPERPILHVVAANPCSRCKEPVPVGSGSSLCARCRGELSL